MAVERARCGRLNAFAVFAFWAAYVLTRPLGASLGDLLSQPAGKGGVGFGSLATSLLFLASIAALIVYLSMNPQKEAIPVNAADRHE